MDAKSARYWTMLPDGRIECELCPRECRLRDGQRGFCFVRARQGDHLVLITYGRSSGFCVDPIEKKPLNHFLPGSTALSFGTAGCNLGCKFCQNWDISKSRDFDRLQDQASPSQIAEAAATQGCRSVAYTYNDPVIFAEYAIDVAQAVHQRGLFNVAVTAGYINPEARADFFAPMDAANVDLKSFSDHFYANITGGRLQPVLDTLTYLVHETKVWVEITTLLILGYNDSSSELYDLSAWVLNELGPDVPLHFSAFHPAYRMSNLPATPARTLRRARSIALDAGLNFVYTGNVHDADGDATFCPGCGERVIERDWFTVLAYRLDAEGCCSHCGYRVAGRFGAGAEVGLLT